MPPIPAEIIRSAAARLTHLEPTLPAQIESRLQEGIELEQPTRLEPLSVALAALIMSVAHLGWSIYSDLGRSRKPPADLVERRIRLEIPVPSTINLTQRDLVIKTVVEEIINYD